MRIAVAGRGFPPPVLDGIAVRAFRDGVAERVYRVHIETFADMTDARSTRRRPRQAGSASSPCAGPGDVAASAARC
jgi:hypothetical protein